MINTAAATAAVAKRSTQASHGAERGKRHSSTRPIRSVRSTVCSNGTSTSTLRYCTSLCRHAASTSASNALQARSYARASPGVTSIVRRSPDLRINEYGIPDFAAVEPVRASDQVQGHHFVAARRQQLERTLAPGRVEKVRDDNRQTATPLSLLKLADGTPQVRAAVGGERRRATRARAAIDGRALSGDDLGAQPIGERQQRHAIEVGRPDVAERGGDPERLIELAVTRHRPAGVDEQIDAEILVLVEQAQHQSVESLVRLPVDVPDVVALGIRPVVGELDAASAMPALALAAAGAGEGPRRHEPQPLQRLQEARVKPHVAP